jgi:hypothetical protein
MLFLARVTQFSIITGQTFNNFYWAAQQRLAWLAVKIYNHPYRRTAAGDLPDRSPEFKQSGN